MTRSVAIAIGVLAVSPSAFAQTATEVAERALAAAPRQLREAATVIRWKPDYTHETLDCRGPLSPRIRTADAGVT